MCTSMKILHWHLTRLQPLLRHNAVQIGCRLQSRVHCILNTLHKCPAICCLPPHRHDFVNVQMLKCWLMLSAFWIHWLLFHNAVCCFACVFCMHQMETLKKKKLLVRTFYRQECWKSTKLTVVLNPESLAVHHVKLWKTTEGQLLPKRLKLLFIFYRWDWL